MTAGRCGILGGAGGYGIPTVAMMVTGRQRVDEIRQGWFRRLEGRGVVNAENHDDGVIGYLGPAAPGTAQKRSQLTEEFIWFRRVYIGGDRSSEWTGV
jgi:hypothetical protein